MGRNTEAQVAVRLARSAYAQAEFAEALAWLDQALEVDPGNEELDFHAGYQCLRADVHAAMGDVPQATFVLPGSRPPRAGS